MAIEGFDDALSDEEEAKLRRVERGAAPPPIE
jgi:hypothetical protein